MSQNRNKLIEMFIGNLSNAIIHEILEKAIQKEEVSNKYLKEIKTSIESAQKYRSIINPIKAPLIIKDIDYIRNKLVRKVESDLKTRASRNYENIDMTLIKPLIEKRLKELKITG